LKFNSTCFQIQQKIKLFIKIALLFFVLYYTVTESGNSRLFHMSENKVSYKTAQSNDVGQRLDNFLMSLYRKIPKAKIYSIIRTGQVRINKKRIKPLYRLTQGDQIRIPPLRLNETTTKHKPNDASIQKVKKAILYEDSNYLLVNKPPGLPVHAGSGHQYGLIELLRLARDKHDYYELVHRIDEATTGCILIAKKKTILRDLHQLFMQGHVKKKYSLIAKSTSQLDWKMLDVNLHLLKMGHGHTVKTIVDKEGKAARTKFTLINHFDNLYHIEARPYTGRTHQIRVHASHLGFPILGDCKYSQKTLNSKNQSGCMMLHATQLQFKCPITGATKSFAAPIPEEMSQWIKKIATKNA
jgi:23S rRNA pseudouridine955/2504/2580 synthase